MGSTDIRHFRRSVLPWGAALLLSACRAQTTDDLPPSVAPPPPPPGELEVATLELQNPSAFARSQSPVYLAYYDLGLERSALEGRSLLLRASDQTIPVQPIDQDGDGTKDGIFALVDLAPAATRSFRVVAVSGAATESPPAQAAAEISVKRGGEWKPREKDPKLKEYVGGEFVNVTSFTPPPEHTDHSNLIRYEGPGIESDKVGYRIYLDERNGFDIFGKKTTAPALHAVGLDGYESYHHLAPWGMDILKVGASLGTGGFGAWNGTGVEMVSRVSGWETTITEAGGLYASFRIVYEDWQVGGSKTDVRADFSMHG